MNYAELTDDELRLEVARRCGYRMYAWKDEAYLTLPSRTGILPNGYNEVDALPAGNTAFFTRAPDYPHDLTAAIALLDGMTYPDGVSVEYNIGKETRYSGGNLLPPGCIVYVVTIWGHNPIHCDDYEATADTLPRAACEAWLMWMDGKEARHDNS